MHCTASEDCLCRGVVVELAATKVSDARHVIVKGCESALVLFISFKCTLADNIYLFIISERHLRIFFYYRIISLTSSLEWGELNEKWCRCV